MDLRPGIQNVMKLASYELKKSDGKTIEDLLKEFDSDVRVELALKRLMEFETVNDYITRYGLYDLIYEELVYTAKKSIPEFNQVKQEVEVLDIPLSKKEEKIFNPTEVIIEGDEDVEMVDLDIDKEKKNLDVNNETVDDKADDVKASHEEKDVEEVISLETDEIENDKEISPFVDDTINPNENDDIKEEPTTIENDASNTDALTIETNDIQKEVEVVSDETDIEEDRQVDLNVPGEVILSKNEDDSSDLKAETIENTTDSLSEESNSIYVEDEEEDEKTSQEQLEDVTSNLENATEESDIDVKDNSVITSEEIEVPIDEKDNSKDETDDLDNGEVDNIKPIDNDGFEFKEELSKELLERIDERKSKAKEEVIINQEEIDESEEEQPLSVNEAEMIDKMAEMLLSQIQSVEVVERKGMYM